MSQNTRASGVLASPHGRTSNVSGSGMARTSASWMREKPSIEEPSNVIPSSRAFSNSAGLMAKLFRLPSTSVNQRRISRTPRSSTERRTYSRCWSNISDIAPVWPPCTANGTRRRRGGVQMALQTVSTSSLATTYGSMLALGRRSSR